MQYPVAISRNGSGNEMQEISRLASELTNYTGDAQWSEFVHGAAPDQVAFAKMFLQSLKKARAGGSELVEVNWKMSVAIQNLDGALTYDFYLSPAMLATVGDAGLFTTVGVAFNGIGVTDTKLKATVSTVLPAVFYRWIYQYPTYANKVTIAASASTGIDSGYIKHANINPESDNGVDSYVTLLLANYNISESFQSTKAEIYDQFLLLSEQNVIKANVLPSSTMNYSLDLKSYVPAIYANMFNKGK